MNRESRGPVYSILDRPGWRRRWGLWCLPLLLISSLWVPVDGRCERRDVQSQTGERGQETGNEGEGKLATRNSQLVKEVPLGIDEKLGATIPLDLTFRDEQGNPVRLRDLIKRPILLSLVYLTCPNVCPRILSSMAQVLEQLDLEAGRDFTVATISFDERDRPVGAREKKKNYLKAIGKSFPEKEWRFLTGSSETIRTLTDALGFRFHPRGDAFDHPASLIVLSEGGKIIRYLNGETYLPIDVKMALMEASADRVGPTIRRALLLCFSYDPEGRTTVFNVLKVSATGILLFAAVFLMFLVWTGRMRKKGAR